MVANVGKVNYVAPCSTAPNSFNGGSPTVEFPLKKFVGTYGQFSLSPTYTFQCTLDLDSFDTGFTSGTCANEEAEFDFNPDFVNSFLTLFKSDYSLRDEDTANQVNITVSTAIDDVVVDFNLTVSIDRADLIGQGYYSSFKNTPQQLATTFINIMNYFNIAAAVIVGFSIRGFFKKMLNQAKGEAMNEAQEAASIPLA